MSLGGRLPISILQLFSGGDDPAAAYAASVLATSPLAYWKLNENGGTDILDSSGNSYDGVSTGVTWDGTQSPVGEPVPSLDGTNDVLNMYSAGFATAFDMDEFTILFWLKPDSAGVWTDSTVRKLQRFWRDADNTIEIGRTATNNTLDFKREGGATTKQVTVGGFSSADFISVALSCSVGGGGLLTAGDLRAYGDGAQIGSTATGNIAATGSGFGAGRTVFGALQTSVSQVWHGYLADAIVWDRPIDSDILALMT